MRVYAPFLFGALFGALLIGCVTETRPPGLNQQEARIHAQQLAQEEYGDFFGQEAFLKSDLPSMVANRWVWFWRGGIAMGDAEITVSFLPDGSSPQTKYDYITSYMPPSNAVIDLTPKSFQSRRLDPFYQWPLEKQIQKASVIAVATWQQADGILKCVISEILKQASNTTFHFKIGDEFPRGNQRVQDGTSYGDGQIIFFTGSPPMFRYATTYSSNRIIGMGDMPISELRSLIQQQR